MRHGSSAAARAELDASLQAVADAADSRVDGAAFADTTTRTAATIRGHVRRRLTGRPLYPPLTVG